MKNYYDSHYLKDAFNLAKETQQKNYNYFKHIEKGFIVDLGCGTGEDANN
jgi:hypothetical protein